MTKSLDFSEIDFAEHAPAPTADKLQILSDLVGELELAEVAVAEAAAILAEKKNRLTSIVEHELPDLMIELNQPILHTSDGRKVQVKEIVRVSLPEAKRPKGHAWLIANGHAGIVKNTIEIAFAATQGEEANNLLSKLEKSHGANARRIQKVESSTLTAFCKKRLEAENVEDFEGTPLPRDIFEIREFNHAKVSKK